MAGVGQQRKVDRPFAVGGDFLADADRGAASAATIRARTIAILGNIVSISIQETPNKPEFVSPAHAGVTGLIRTSFSKIGLPFTRGAGLVVCLLA